VLFHGGFEMFAGGFVGVDVFFVISGYLITTILLREMRKGEFSFLRFYERRARRILPALSLMLLCSIPLAWISLTPLQFYNYAQGMGATSIFLANVLFWQESDYFNEESEANPLLHMWSLAVEEQFYLFFPIMLLGLTWLAKRNERARPMIVVGGLATLAAASYVWMEWWLRRDPSGNFFLTPSRVWELIVGSFCALILLDRKPQPNAALSAIGLAAVLWSVFAFDETTAFPSALTLVPVLGTALIVVFADRSTITGRVLSLRWLVGIGLISYSTYLWHQPLFATARLARQNVLGPLAILGLAGLSLVLGWLSWRFVERPFRKPESGPLARRSVIFALTGLSIVGFLGLSGIGQVTDGLPGRFDLSPLQEEYIASSFSLNPVKQECQAEPGGANARSYDAACIFGRMGAEPAVVILGDSHATELGWELGEALKKEDASIRMLAFGGCGPFDDVGRSGPAREKCATWSREMYDDLIADDTIEAVVVTYKLMYHLAGTNRGNYPNLPPERDPDIVSYVQANTAEVVNGLSESGKQVIFVMQAPETPRRTRPTVYHFMNDDDTQIQGVPRQWWNERSALADETLTAFDASVEIIDPADTFCDAVTCWAGRDGIALYSDDNHVTLAGAALIAEEITARLD